ncbi:MAG: hypothetical protein DSZ06_01205 [Sulfurospirillum sp.]|nr:MAG: hypothetical protein DSZ06_01205 [Sulfurospirillum sp.]
MHNKNGLVLIVDDVDVNRMTIKLSLKKEGFDFLEAKNGLEALDIALEHKPDVILMDAMMPEMDGFEATKKIREHESTRRIPILMITALEEKNDKIRALEVGVNDFISKPFDKTELIARCRSYVQISNLNRQYSLATINPATNLPNKLALQKDLSKSQKEEELFLIQINNFNENENFYGSKLVLDLEKEFSFVTGNFFNSFSKSKLYHISSGKYAILLKNSTLLDDQGIEEYCINFIDMIKNSEFSINENRFNVNVTMSYSKGSENLYENANQLLNAAINQKREFLYGEDMIKNLKEQLTINLKTLNQIKNALKNDLFIPHFQPIFCNKTKSIYKYETLIRMRDEENNLIYPYPSLINVAKSGKFYNQITKLLIEKVFDKIRDTGMEFSLNLSSLDIENPQMCAYLLDSIKKNSDISNKMIFELLEDKDTEDYEVVKNFINIAKGYGIKIAIDDFGSGYSNFMRILEFEPDIIKIDGSLIKDIATNQTAQNTVEIIKLFADKIGAQTVAEFVENKEIYDKVNDLGIDYSQGYYIAKATEELLREKVFDTLEEV